MGKRPYSADELRHDLSVNIAVTDILHSGECTKRQSQYIAWFMDSLFNMRFIRLAIVEWLLQRPIASSNDLTFAEAHALLDWLSGNPAVVRIEAASVLVAAFMQPEREAVR